MPHWLLPHDLQMRETALIRAAHNGHLAVVEHLLQSGADIAAHDLVSNTGPLCVTCKAVRTCVLMLINTAAMLFCYSASMLCSAAVHRPYPGYHAAAHSNSLRVSAFAKDLCCTGDLW